MVQFDGADRAEAGVAQRLRAELALDLQVLAAKLKAYSLGLPGFGARFLTEDLEPTVAELRKIVGQGTTPVRPAERVPVGGEEPEPAESAATVHPFEPRRPAPNYTQHSTSDIHSAILRFLDANEGPTRIDDIQTMLEDRNHTVTASNLSVILHRMVRDGLIYRPHRGVYAAQPSDTAPGRRMRGD